MHEQGTVKSFALHEKKMKASTYDDEQNEVDEVVEGVGIHDVVHDLHPTFQGDHLQGRVDSG